MSEIIEHNTCDVILVPEEVTSIIDVGHVSHTAIINKTFNLSSHRFRVPISGTLYLDNDDIPTSRLPIFMRRDYSFIAAEVSLDVSDPNDYIIEIIINSLVIETLTIPSGTTRVVKTFSQNVTSSDELRVRIILDSGSTKSTFYLINFALEAIFTSGT